MPPINTARGQVSNEAVVYFENGKGRVIIAPHPQHPTPFGYRREVASNVQDIERLSKRMAAQEHQHYEELMESDWKRMEGAIKENRSNLFARLLSSDCSTREAAIIRAMMQKLDDNLHRMYNVNTVGGTFEMERQEAPKG